MPPTLGATNKDVELLAISVNKPTQDVKLGVALELDDSLFSHGGLVTVKRVEEGGLCHSAGLKAGDIVDKVNGKKVEEPGPATMLIKQAVGQVVINVIRRRKRESDIPEGAQGAIALAAASTNDPNERRIQIPKKEMDAFISDNRPHLNEEAIEVFKDMFADDQRRVLQAGPMKTCKTPDELYRVRLAINLEKEQEHIQRKGFFEPNQVEEWETKKWCKDNRRFVDEHAEKQLLGFSPEDQWRIISEGPAVEDMDPAHMIKERAKRSKELAKTVVAMFARRVEAANEAEQAAQEAEKKPLFDKKLAGSVQDYLAKMGSVGAEVRPEDMRCGGAALQHEVEEDRTKLVGKVKGVDGVVEILKRKYECEKGQRFRVIGDHGGPAGMWRLEMGKTIPKTHLKEGGWRWVLEVEDPEPAKKTKPAKAPEPPKPAPKKEEPKKRPPSDSDSDEDSSESGKRGARSKKPRPGKAGKRRQKASSDDEEEDTRKPKRGKRRQAGSEDDDVDDPRPKRRKRRQANSDEDEDDARAPRKKKRRQAASEDDDDGGRGPPKRRGKAGAGRRRGADAEEDSEEDDDSREGGRGVQRREKGGRDKAPRSKKRGARRRQNDEDSRDGDDDSFDDEEDGRDGARLQGSRRGRPEARSRGSTRR